MKAWLTYAGVSAVVIAAGALLGIIVAPAGSAGAIGFAAALAYALQLVAFAALVAVRRRNELFLIGWVTGMVLRFGALGVVALWLARSPVFPRTVALVSLVAFVFVLLILEPLFLRRGLQTQ